MLKNLLRSIITKSNTATDKTLAHMGGYERFVQNQRLSARLDLDWDHASEEAAEEISAGIVCEVVAEVTQTALTYARCDRPADATVSCEDASAPTALVLEIQKQIRSLNVHCTRIRIIVSPTILTVLHGYSGFHRIIAREKTVQLPHVGVFDGCNVLVDQYASDSAAIIIGYDWFVWDTKRKVVTRTENPIVDPSTLIPVMHFDHDYTIKIKTENYRLIKPEVWTIGFI